MDLAFLIQFTEVVFGMEFICISKLKIRQIAQMLNKGYFFECHLFRLL